MSKITKAIILLSIFFIGATLSHLFISNSQKKQIQTIDLNKIPESYRSEFNSTNNLNVPASDIYSFTNENNCTSQDECDNFSKINNFYESQVNK